MLLHKHTQCYTCRCTAVNAQVLVIPHPCSECEAGPRPRHWSCEPAVLHFITSLRATVSVGQVTWTAPGNNLKTPNTASSICTVCIKAVCGSWREKHTFLYPAHLINSLIAHNSRFLLETAFWALRWSQQHCQGLCATFKVSGFQPQTA